MNKDKSNGVYLVIIFSLIFIGLMIYKIAPEPFNSSGFYLALVFAGLGIGNAIGSLIKDKRK